MNDSWGIRIGQNTKVSALASRILGQVRKSGYVTLETAGAGAINAPASSPLWNPTCWPP